MVENFDLIFGQSAGSQYAWNDSDYQNGWQTVGDTPPTAEQFDALQRRSDMKSQELNNRLTPIETKSDSNTRQPSTAYSAGDMQTAVGLKYGWYLECTVGGTTSASALEIPDPLVENDTIIDNTVTWTIRKIGSGEDLTVVDSIVPTSNQGSVAEIINGVANMLKQIKGDSDWKTAPVISLASILGSLGTNFEVTTDETTGVFSVPALGITGLMAQNGYISLGRLFGGLILQWGTVNPNYWTDVNFNIQYQNQCYAVISVATRKNANYYTMTQIVNEASFRVAIMTDSTIYPVNSANANWFAIGI